MSVENGTGRDGTGRYMMSLSVENERAGAGRDGENSIENECGEWDGTGRSMMSLSVEK